MKFFKMQRQTIGKVLLVVGLITALLLIKKFVLSPAGKSVIESSFNEPLFAVYDRSSGLTKHPINAIEHIALNLGPSADQEFFKEITQLLATKADVMITIKLTGIDDGSLLEKVNTGVFDNTFSLLFKTLKRHRHAVMLRLNPEMEVPVRTYPWQYQSSAAYVDAFRHFARLCKAAAPAAQLVWGPAGYPGTEEYYPGDDFVDVISITLSNESEKLLNAYPPYPDLQTAVRRKLLRVRFMDKPVMILAQNKSTTDSTVLHAIQHAVLQIRKEHGIIYSTATKHENKIAKRTSKTIVGVYDPKQLLTDLKPVQTEHLFIDLAHVQNGSFEKDFNEVVKRQHDVIVSFEPWRDQKARRDTNVLSNTIQGIYDMEFRALYRILKSTKQTVYLRFAHEMEIPVHRYAWQSQDPVLYIKAFRYFMNFDSSNHIKRVWGPAGDRGSMEWWPGEDVVDFVSVAIYGLPDKNITDPKMQESFGTIYDRKFHRIAFSGKPVFVTEFGVKGPDDFKQHWLDDAARVVGEHKEIAGISYFNLADNPEVWGDMPAPDWSVTRATFEKFISKLSD